MTTIVKTKTNFILFPCDGIFYKWSENPVANSAIIKIIENCNAA
jgi:hypothetical protein